MSNFLDDNGDMPPVVRPPHTVHVGGASGRVDLVAACRSSTATGFKILYVALSFECVPFAGGECGAIPSPER